MSPKVANSLPERSEIVECTVEEDIHKLFRAIDIGRPRQCCHKSAMKRPVRISKSVSLKQAHRGLSISQASNMAAVMKRTSRPSASSPGVTENCEKGCPVIPIKGNTMEVPLVIERGKQAISNEIAEISEKVSTTEKAIDLSKRSLRSRNFASSNTNVRTLDYSVGKGIEKLEKILMRSKITTKNAVIKADERSRSREKEEISQSSKSSIGEFSSSGTSYSEESICLAGLHIRRRPHMSTDLRWEAINYIKKKQNLNLGLKHFKLLRKVGRVYVSELIGSGCFFAVKVMDYDILKSGNTMARARGEKEIVGILDHPFLPTLYADFAMGKFACLVMDYCPCGNLQVLRRKQVTKSFPEQAARFYAAEVLLALEYLHMLGVVYRDLKPENILIREDGHIMLSNFDLSFRSAVDSDPTLLESSSGDNETNSDSSCLGPLCLDPTFQLSCLTPRTRKPKPGSTSHIVVEPTAARSNSFVGPTHEYLAPEILGGEGHGSAVDWWSFGILLYELLYGVTPFKGSTDEETASNVAMQRLKFPQRPMVSSRARDMIGRLLEKEPKNRMGSAKGAAEIKVHPFFEGLNWGLLRRETPPEVPKILDLGGDGDINFEMF